MKKQFYGIIFLTLIFAFAFCTFSVFAAHTVSIESIDFLPIQSEDDFVNLKFDYSIVEDESITGLSNVIFTLLAEDIEDTFYGNEPKIVYIDEILATGTYTFPVGKQRIKTALGKNSIERVVLYLRIGGNGVAQEEKRIFYCTPTDETKYGDLDFNGTIDFLDALFTLRSSAGSFLLSDTQTGLVDVNGDGNITYNDALLILRCASGAITEQEMTKDRE